jgi:GTP-binding protein HflX
LATHALILCPQLRGAQARARSAEAVVEEAVGLARAISLDVAHSELVRLTRYRPATLVGKGAVERLGEIIGALGIDLAIVDAALSAVQQRNLEKAWSCKVIDRTGLILEIFGERAQTKEGQLQVELAALTYQRSRLVRSWTHLERQRGGFGFLGGPGESQLEMDRRLIDERVVRIKRDLKDVARTRALHRRARRRVPYPVVALVGYTNAGKSTLFNRLTSAAVLAKDILFATLDPTMRAVRLPSGRDIILSDTVGFISDLPTDLVAAFRATLEEVLEADMIVHVRDVSHPDTLAQREDVHRVLADLGIAPEVSEGLLEALNKIDRLEPASRSVLQEQAKRDPRSLPISALTGEGMEALLAEIDRRLALGRTAVEIKLGHADGALVAWLYKYGEVLDRREDERYCYLKVRLDPADFARFERMRAKGVTGATTPASSVLPRKFT